MQKDNVQNEVQKLLNKKLDKNALSGEIDRLRHKVGDDEVVDQIHKAYLEKYNKTLKRARKFADLVRKRYGNTNYPLHTLLEKAQKYKIKHNLTNEEYNLFQRMYEEELVGLKPADVMEHKTNMARVLGDINVAMNKGTMKLNDSDYKHMQELIKLNATTKALHSQVLLQSLQYKDCDFEAMSGKYDRNMGFGPGEHIHPVIAALFLPKINILESTFLQSNISSIVKARFNNEPLMSKSDYELFYALSKDPNDIVCDNRSSVLDLLNRFQIQNQLWNCVLGLRNGQYYNNMYRDFMTSIDTCKYNKYDNPDLVYGRYDGTVIKRLFAAFSFRPTVVASMSSVVNNMILNPYQQTIKPNITAVPMVNLRLPISLNSNPAPVDLMDSVNQNQVLFQNGTFVPHQTSIVYSNGVLVFCVDRRSTLAYTAPDQQPFNITKLPIAVAGFEAVNTHKVEFEHQITVNKDNYRLRSVVVAVTNDLSQQKNIAVGSAAVVIGYAGDEVAGVPLFSNDHYLYEPYAVHNPTPGNVKNEAPITSLRETPDPNSDDQDFKTLAETKGLIFVYELCGPSQAN
jgi:hypothetical protein